LKKIEIFGIKIAIIQIEVLKGGFMKKVLFIIVIVLFTSLALFMTLFSQEFTYVGAAKCKICHRSDTQGKQFPIWEESRHSQSYASLSSPEAAGKAKEMGVTNPSESPQCLKCHAPLFEKAPELKAEGVTCELCHGPGSEYKKLSVMKSREESVQKGLLIYETENAIKTQCLTCHAKAHGKSFDFAACWKKIRHPVPEK
jgi:hypothetical protein